jgi:hypothetical protein
MNADSIFLKGSDHTICQDYSLHFNPGNNDEDLSHHIIVCDGCSSSIMTDIGARILALLTSKNLKQRNLYMFKEDFFDSIIREINIIKYTLFNKYFYDEIFDATLLYTEIYQGKLFVNIIGDGVMLIKKKNGNYKIFNIKYPSGYPLYLSYSLNADRMNSFKRHSLYREIEQFNIVNDKIESVIEKDEDMNEIYLDFKFNIDEIEYVVLFSDGIHSFQKIERAETFINKKNIDFLDIIKRIGEFKSFKGNFVQRRINKFLKQCREDNIIHYDDLSVASIYCGD